MAHGYFKIEGKPMLVMAHGTIGLQHADWKDFLWAIGGVVLVALAAAGIRYVFGWPVAYWIAFAALLAAIIATIVAIQLGIVFS